MTSLTGNPSHIVALKLKEGIKFAKIVPLLLDGVTPKESERGEMLMNSKKPV